MDDLDERPLCKCHTQPMYKRGGGQFRCSVEARERSLAWYFANRERAAKKAARLRKTPGTYAYNACHGIGSAGFVKKAGVMRWVRQRENLKDTAALDRLRESHPDLWEAVSNG